MKLTLLTTQRIMKSSLCLLCLKRKGTDFIARCGHNFHDDCIKKQFDASSEFKCPKCGISLIKSKVLEGILFKASEQEYVNYDNLVSFFVILDKGDQLYIRFDMNLITTAINLGLDFNVHTDYLLKLLKSICDRDSVHQLNKLLDLGLKMETIKNNFDPQIWYYAFEKESFSLMFRFKDFGFYPKDLNEELVFDFRLSKWLIENEFEVNPGISKSSLILQACKDRNLNKLKHLLETGVDIDFKDFYGRSLFHRIVFSLFIFDPKKDPFVILSKVSQEYLDILKILLDSGANIETVDKQGVTPLYTAIKKGNIDLINFLLSNGASLNTPKIKELGSFPHILTSFLESKGSNSTLMKIFAFVTDINEVDSNGQTCLHKAIDMKYDADFVKTLLAHNANTNCQDLNGNTPLHYLGLKESYQREKVKLIVEKGADIKLQNNEGKPAIEDILKFLEKEKAKAKTKEVKK